MRELSIGIAIAALSTFVVAAQANGQAKAMQSSPAKQIAAVGTLPAGPGHDTVIKVCSTCHAPSIAAQQRLSKQGWHDMVELMASRGAQGSEKDFADITAYLAKNFPDTPAK